MCVGGVCLCACVRICDHVYIHVYRIGYVYIPSDILKMNSLMVFQNSRGLSLANFTIPFLSVVCFFHLFVILHVLFFIRVLFLAKK